MNQYNTSLKLLYESSSSSSGLADALGVTEPLIQTKGVNQIIIELAGVQDTSRAESLIKNTGKLEFILVKDNTKTWTKIIKKKDILETKNLNENEKTKLMCLSGVKKYPMRVKCATLPWHTLVSAMTDKPGEVNTEKED